MKVFGKRWKQGTLLTNGQCLEEHESHAHVLNVWNKLLSLGPLQLLTIDEVKSHQPTPWHAGL